MTARHYQCLLSLRERYGESALVLVGGVRKEAKLRLVAERFGLEVEWYEIDGDSPKAAAAFVNRLRGSNVGAVLLLQAFLPHKFSGKIIAACVQYNVPFALADNGGSAALEQAFNDLER